MTQLIRRLLGIAASLAVSVGCLLPASNAIAMPLHAPAADEWVPSQIQPTKYPLRWSRATLDDKVTLDRLGRRPVPYWWSLLLACERDRQLDCVESIGLVSESGDYSPGRWVKGITFDAEARPSEGLPALAVHQTVWDIPGLIVGGKPAQIHFVGALAGEGFGGGGMAGSGLIMDLSLYGVDEIPSTPDSPRGCQSSDPTHCYALPDFPDGTRLRVVIRTSWLAPSAVAARGTDVTLDSEDLRGGAYRWTLTGNPMLVQNGGGRAEVLRGYPTWVYSTFQFAVSDPRLLAAGSECSVFRPILFSGNAQGLDIPQWNAREGSLDLNMEAPHYWADRKTVWRGYYETSIPAETARCLWGIDPRLTNYLSVGVYSEDGEEKAATTSIGLKDNLVQVRAYDFTFSSNIVRAEVNVQAGQRCFTAGVKIKDLTCTKKGKRLVWVKSRR